MTDEPTPAEPVTPAPETRAATFSTVVTASLLTCLLTGAGIVVMHESLKTKTLDLQYGMSDTLEKLNRRIGALESQTRELAARPVPDNAPVEELRSGVAEARNTITALSERLAEVEKKPAAAPMAEAPTLTTTTGKSPLKTLILSGTPYQAELTQWHKEHPKAAIKTSTLDSYAAKGLPTEAALKKELNELIAKQSAPTAEFGEQTLAGRINTQLSQFISIKKKNTAAPELEAIRTKLETASLPELETELRALQTSTRAPFESWLQSANTHNKAMAELEQLGGAQ